MKTGLLLALTAAIFLVACTPVVKSTHEQQLAFDLVLEGGSVWKGSGSR